ncbi:hypothetical protein GL50803_002861 [Giardia duodenalis]|uniref:Uncharacterized protein n=1 Tax=Giardia intestinalis (strain ATCC 50803 / WB clone C6) TaxID=184922 RepID=D3KI10_GIAIC|nr:hypothetical protein GL50803_002861 [Giardia intestinalis]KAE8304446.1 hypothetical protein GL50803_002861 [Giardia intestinalis]
MELDKCEFGEEWSRCEEVLGSCLQTGGCFLTFDELSNVLLSSGFATSGDSLNEVLSALQIHPERRYTVYDVERAAILLTNKPQEDEIFTMLVETLDPASTGTIHINQLRCLLEKFGASVADTRWAHFQNEHAPDGSEKFTYEQLRAILRKCKDSKNHEPSSDGRHSATERA